jgi:hypothetical protein
MNGFASGSDIKGSVADPRSSAFLTPGSGMGKKSRSGSGILYEIFYLKNCAKNGLNPDPAL